MLALTSFSICSIFKMIDARLNGRPTRMARSSSFVAPPSASQVKACSSANDIIGGCQASAAAAAAARAATLKRNRLPTRRVSRSSSLMASVVPSWARRVRSVMSAVSSSVVRIDDVAEPAINLQNEIANCSTERRAWQAGFSPSDSKQCSYSFLKALNWCCTRWECVFQSVVSLCFNGGRHRD